MVWQIRFDPSAEKELRKLDRQPAERILDFYSTGSPNWTIRAVSGRL
jgi:mRNA-degrading endonuclease RelE of RelBE toxin-antitoxin system